MNLRHRLLSYLTVLHLVFLGLAFTLYQAHPVVFVGMEVLLIFSLIVGVYLIDKALQPFDYARQFHDLLEEHNYSARIRTSSNKELRDLAAVFNQMLDALYQERLKLGEQRGFLTRLLEATPSAVLVFDFDGRISLMNHSAQTLLGLAQPEGKTLDEWLQDGDLRAQFIDDVDEATRQRGLSLLCQLDKLLSGESKLISDLDGRRYRCQRNQFFDRGFARHFLLIDELTEELENSEKATYEKLVRVLAHEVNNTVAVTGSVLESLLFYTSQLQASDRIDFSTAIEAVKRRNGNLGEFIERFTRVVKMPDPEPRPMQVKDMLEDILRLYREQCKNRGIKLDWVRCDPLPDQFLDSNLMELALLNIIKNAMEAVEATMQESGTAGYIYLELINEKEKEKGIERINLAIIDSGNRLSEVPSGQLFTPFFTTKKGGQGIGLLFVREVLNRHGYAYRLAPNDQGETRFDIWFDIGR